MNDGQDEGQARPEGQDRPEGRLDPNIIQRLFEDVQRLEEKLDQLIWLVVQNLRMEKKMSAELDTAVATLVVNAAQETADDAAVMAMLNGIPAVVAAALAQAGVDDTAAAAAVKTVNDTLTANSAAIKAAMAATTPPAAAAAKALVKKS